MTTLEAENEDIPNVEYTGYDASKFEGEKVEIEGYRTDFKDDKFKGRVKKLTVFSKVLDTFTSKTGKTVEIRASEMFNLTPTEDGKWGVSQDPRHNLVKFMKKVGVTTVKELVGKKAIVRMRGRYLGFAR